jgi:oligopeptide/dipeptide ABC transporter ATP-binding protein
MDNILEVKDLKVSFRTNSGTVKAVRDISFDLERGKTLAIVGESGSGKSVTSKAILGILAGNSIIEGGEILYDGKDLLKLSEEEMHSLRGDKISMIFQDPLSSLNPIVKIGKQITEAMLLKNKINRKEARKDFNDLLKLMEGHMAASGAPKAASAKEMCESFDKYCIEANKLENSYNQSLATAEKLYGNVADFLFKAEKHQKQDVKGMFKEFSNDVKRVNDPFFTAHYKEKLHSVSSQVNKAMSGYSVPRTGKNAPVPDLPENVRQSLKALEDLMGEMVEQEKPVFFRIGFYSLKNKGVDLYSMPVAELNEKALTYFNENFLDDFVELETAGVKHSFEEALEKKKQVMPALEKAKTFYEGTYSKADGLKLAKELGAQVEGTIDKLEIIKDSKAYTFGSSLAGSIEKYFHYQEQNPKEEARFARQTAKREALIAKGKTVDWKVVPKNVLDLDELKDEVVHTVEDMIAHYEEDIENAPHMDFTKRSEDIIDYLKDKASKVVYVITKEMAKEKAISLMEEVGIAEPRMRYYQYPFEFSGGMRQRIVIAIALAADPEILICDEPTTALDVTIQAQILELINRLKAERNLSIIFITHDLGVVANMADDIAVMYAGKIVEYGTADDIFYDPRHPYTWALLSSMPDLDTKEKLESIPGTPPNMIYPPVGDAFADRNKYAMKIDYEKQPPMFQITETHKAATWLLHPDAPKVEMPKIISDRIARMKEAEVK